MVAEPGKHGMANFPALISEVNQPVFDQVNSMAQTTSAEYAPENITQGIVILSQSVVHIAGTLGQLKQLMIESRNASDATQIQTAQSANQLMNMNDTTFPKLNSLMTECGSAVQELRSRTTALESTINQLKNNPTNPTGGIQQRRFKICESKAVMNRPSFGLDRAEFREWFDGLVNALVQHYPAARKFVELIKKQMDMSSDKIPPTWTTMESQWATAIHGIEQSTEDMLKLNEDLYFILKEKTVGDAKARVNAVEPGNGLEALCKMYLWYSGTSGLAMGARMDLLMRPKPVTKPEELASALERWNEQLRFVTTHSTDDTNFTMGSELKCNALKHIMLNFPDKYESIESHVRAKGPMISGDEKFSIIEQEIREFAIRKRLDEQFMKAKGDPMQIGGIDNNESTEPCQNQESSADEESIQPNFTGDPWTDLCLMAMNVGKGFGKKGKSFGKGFNGNCHKCGKFGHKAMNCQAPIKANTNQPAGKGSQNSGSCYICGQTSHYARDCPMNPNRGKGKGKGKSSGYQGKGINEAAQWIGAIANMYSTGNPWYQGAWEPESGDICNLGNSIDSIECPKNKVCKPSISTAPSNEWSVTVNKSRSNKDMRPIRRIKVNCCQNGNHTTPQKSKGMIAPLTREDTPEVLNVEQQGTWERLTVVVDSGACETVGPVNVATGFDLRETTASRNGVHYVAANGTKICNHGERNIRGLNAAGNRIGFAMQAADVNKVLAAVNQVVKAGNKVVFDEGPNGMAPNHHIYNYATGTRTEMELRNGQYLFEMWVPNLGNSQSGEAAEVAIAAETVSPETQVGFQGQETPK